MLSLNEDTGIIEISKEAQFDPLIVFLKAQDKTKNKRKFYDQIVYLFYMYKRKGEYSERLPDDRRSLIQARYLKELTIDEIENDVSFLAVKDLFLKEQFTIKEQSLFAVHEDIQKQIESINSIPYSIKKKVKVNVSVPKYDLEGLEEDDIGVKTIEKEITISNADEKVKALKSLKELLLFEEDLKEMIKKEERDAKKNRGAFYTFDKQEKK